MTDKHLVREYHYKIRTYQVGSAGKILLFQIFNLLQDVAHHDANSLGFGMPHLLADGKIWVLSRMTIEIDNYPALDDEIFVNTWVKSVSGKRSEREFTIVKNNLTIVRASSLWFCLSQQDHRPALIPGEEKLIKVSLDKQAVTGGAIKVKQTEAVGSDLATGHILRARNSDVDMANHVNNSAYVRWIMDEALTNNQEKQVCRFSINYLSEVFLHDSIGVKRINNVQDTDIHEVINIDSGKVVCRSATSWI